MSVPETTSRLPTVRLEVHQGGRSVPYLFDQIDFLIGTVAGCDLRVPGADLPAILCLLARHPGGITFRRLATTQVLLVNGKNLSRAELNDGDRLTLGALDLYVRIEACDVVALDDEVEALPANVDLARLESQLAERDRRLQVAADEIRALKLQVQTRPEPKARPTELSSREAVGADLLRRELVLSEREEELTRRRQQLDAQAAEVDRHKKEIAAVRQELSDIRRQLHERYQERRDRLAGLQSAVDRAAKKVQESKRELEQGRHQLDEREHLLVRRENELEQQRQALAEGRSELEDQRRALEESQKGLRDELEAKLADVSAREERCASQRQTLEARERQYQSDVLRLDRLQGEIEERQRQVVTREKTLQEREQRLVADSAELDQQAQELDALGARLQEDAADLAKRQTEHTALETQVQQRAAELEAQQAALAGLRSRLERMREEFRTREQEVELQRQQAESAVAEAARERDELERRRRDLESEAVALTLERQQLGERQTVLGDAVTKLKEAQDRVAGEEQGLRQRALELEQRLLGVAEKEALLAGRLDQLADSQSRLDQERATLRERTLALTQSEQAREALQEQLRRRNEELGQRQAHLAEQMKQLEERDASLKALQDDVERQRTATREAFEARDLALVQAEAEMVRRRDELAQLEELQRRQLEELHEKSRQIAEQEAALAQQQAKNQEVWQRQQEQQTAQRQELTALRRQAEEMLLELPEIELRAGTALDRMSHAREHLRDHLAELHTYVRQAQEDLEAGQDRLRHEQALLGQRDQDLRRLQDEHRLALVGFRQQMLEWQGQIAELQRLLARGEKGLENRQAKVEDKARQLDAASQDLAREAAVLEVQQRTVTEQRQEIDRHVVELRDWYRRKMRELAGMPTDALGEPVPVAAADAVAPAVAGSDEAIVPTERDILSLTGPVDVGDQRLGDQLREHQLIDPETLHALLVEARRQRRSLRQILLASGAVTVYQLALIETGNVAGLMLGPVRVIDRLRQTDHETIYRVFDPRRGQEAVLRHLSEEHALDAVLPDEYRQRFRQLILTEAHVAGTLEVLDLAERPAVLQEWLTGLPACDWPPLAAAPGVCYRLLTQAALGLSALHKVGLVHGRLADHHLLLTPQGHLKLCAAAEPAWLTSSEEPTDPTDDLRRLGKIVSSWCTPSGVRKGAKARPLPERMVAILFRLQAEGEAGYGTAQELLNDLDAASGDIPPNPEAWDRLLRYVRDHAMPEATLRQSA